jgi:hypothetical protein
MRYLIALILMVSSAYAVGWQPYVNSRFGVSIDVPPGFVQSGEAPTNNDGLTFISPDGKTTLRLWGNNIVVKNFEDDWRGNFKNDRKDGWAVSYGVNKKQNAMTWNVYSGTKGDLIMYQKSIASCKGTQALHFRIEYPKGQKQEYDAIIARLGKTLKAGPASDCS